MIKLNEKYRHYKNNKEYLTVNFCKMQTHGEWSDAVIYKSTYDDGLYVRDLKDFAEKFTKGS